MSNLREPGDFGTLMEVRLLRWGESSTAGRTITLELHPDEGESHPFKTFKSGKDGQRFWMVLRPIADDETPTPASRHEVGERPLSVIRPVQQGVIHRTDSVEESVLDGGATMQPGCGWICVHAYDICKRIKPGEHCDHCIQDAPGIPLTSAGLTPKARYAAKTPEQKVVTRAAILCGEPEFRTWLAGEDITAAQAAEVLRERCGVESRGEFADNPEALSRFEKLEADYRFLKRLPEQR